MSKVLRRSPHVTVSINDKFTRWAVIGEPFHRRVGKRLYWWCRVRCDCDRGTERTIRVLGLFGRKASKSCGCLKSDVQSARMRTHGKSGTQLHKLYSWMRHRCSPNENGESYPNYAGRGIAICADWLNDFTVFEAWALANGYRAGLYIDRKDNDGPYSPGNCRFVTPLVSANNRRCVRIIEAFGEAKSAYDWSIDPRCRVGRELLKSRLSQNWDAERAIATPQRPGGRPKRR